MEENEHGANPEKKPASNEKQPEPPMTNPTPPPSGSSAGGSGSQQETSMNMDPNLAALLAYLFGFISGLVFYVAETKNKYVRFHALQSILLSVAVVVVQIGLGIVFAVLGALPGLGLAMMGLSSLVFSLFGLGVFIIWIMLMVKAYQGEKWMLPIIGEIADNNS